MGSRGIHEPNRFSPNPLWQTPNLSALPPFNDEYGSSELFFIYAFGMGNLRLRAAFFYGGKQ